ncbi:MAG: hypothetical protein JW934_13425 [Anaerolineae bacterium]|nr:hypothetical protein [Anaerolineae bacterium]
MWFKLDRETLGNPDWLAVIAETRQGITLDHMAWHLIRLQAWPWEKAGATALHRTGRHLLCNQMARDDRLGEIP